MVECRLLGQVENAFKYFRAFDFFALSSIREGLPVAMLEAFAGQVPPIASECNGNSEAIEGLGVGFDIGDSGRLSELMLEAYMRTEDEKIDIIKKIEIKLERNFSENAMRKRFWGLSIIPEEFRR